MRALDWGEDVGPNMIVDDGGDMTLLVLEGAEWEARYEKTGELPDPSRCESDDEKALFNLLKNEIPKNPTRFRKM
jgi:adenosylhomocysteinase